MYVVFGQGAAVGLNGRPCKWEEQCVFQHYRCISDRNRLRRNLVSPFKPLIKRRTN